MIKKTSKELQRVTNVACKKYHLDKSVLDDACNHIVSMSNDDITDSIMTGEVAAINGFANKVFVNSIRQIPTRGRITTNMKKIVYMSAVVSIIAKNVKMINDLNDMIKK